MMNSNPDSPMMRREASTTTATIARALAAFRPGEWWLVLNLYLIVILLLAVAGSALEI